MARARGSAAAPDGASLALECGYSDQSHMIRDFVKLAGLTPLEIFRRASLLHEGHCVG